jgi:hypothetical protein
MASFINEIDNNWYHPFPDLQMSSNEFYSSVEQMIKAQAFPQVKMSRITLSEGGLFSSGREYLRIERNQYIFDLCAAPFGKAFFVSWWVGENSGIVNDFLGRFHLLDRLVGKGSRQRTYFQIDSKTMFKECIHGIILEIIDSITKEKGLRSLSEAERQMTKSSTL